jgi:hypothetical protein
MCYEIHLYTKIWNRGAISSRLKQPTGCTIEWAGGGKDHSIEFVQAKPTIVQLLVLLGYVKDTISNNNNKQNLHM